MSISHNNHTYEHCILSLERMCNVFCDVDEEMNLELTFCSLISEGGCMCATRGCASPGVQSATTDTAM